MAKKKGPTNYEIMDYISDLVNSGLYNSIDDAQNHAFKQIDELERHLKTLNDVTRQIKGTYDDLDKLSNRKYDLFNVKDWKEDLNKITDDYQAAQKNLIEMSQRFEAKWKGRTDEDIRRNQNEYLKDNNILLKAQAQNLELTKKLAAQAVEYYRQGYNVFDRFSARVEEVFKGINKGFGEIGTGFNKSIEAVKKWTKPWGDANQAAANYAKSIGLGSKGMQNLLSDTIRFAKDAKIGINFNKDIKEMLKLQQDYANSVGRNISLSDKQREAIAATSAIFGDQKTVEIFSKLENFGIDTNRASDFMTKMMNSAAKKGISLQKYSDNFNANLKMAQNYTFENGVKGVASMAEKATKLKLEMQTVAQFADKVNTVEGAITTGAKLQVLGGPFAQFADPLGMLYESNADAEGLMDRMINMFGNLGRFDKIKGQVDIGWDDRRKIRVASEAIGVNPTEMFEMIHAKGKRNEIANQMRGLGYSKDLQELIQNTATFDENGKAGVSLNGEFIGIDKLGGREQELIALNQNESEDIKEIAKLLRGWDDTMSGFKKQKDITQAGWVEKSGIGKGIMTMTALLGSSNIALNMIVGLLTAQSALNFGMGAFGMLRGGTRVGAGMFQNLRTNKFMKRNGLFGKNLKMTQRYKPNGIGNMTLHGGLTRQNMNKLILGNYAAKGRGLGINNASPVARGIMQRGAFNAGMPAFGAGIPSIAPHMMGGYGMGGYGMGGYGMGDYGMGSASMVRGNAGHMYTSDGLYLGRQTKKGFQTAKGFKLGTQGRIYTNDGTYVGQTLKNGTFKYSKAFGGGANGVAGGLKGMGGLIKGVGGGLLAGAGAMLGGALISGGMQWGASAIDNKRQKLIEEGKIKENSKEDLNRRMGSTALSWGGTAAGIGSLIGSFFGPLGTLIGAGAGALIGAGAGAIKGAIDKKRILEAEKLKEKISRFRNGQVLQGEYDNKTLSRFAKYVETNDSSVLTLEDIDALKQNGYDYNIIVRAKRFAKGTPNMDGKLNGVVSGPSHENGGVTTVSKNGIYEVEGGEAVIPKNVVNTLNRQDGKFMDNLIKGNVTLKPQTLNTNPLTVSSGLSNSPQVNSPSISEIKLSPLDININGSIKIDGGNGHKVDMTSELLKNPEFISNISLLVNRELNKMVNSRYNKENNMFKYI